MTSYILNTEEQQKAMLTDIGIASVKDLFSSIPEKVRLKSKLNLPPALSEMELLDYMKDLSGRNSDLGDYTCFLGAGIYDHFIPSIVESITSRQEFYTAYTPYQPEISQGTLQAIFEYQTMICELTGMEVSNASMYDGATALAEAVSMACQHTKRNVVLVASTVHPESRQVMETYAKFKGVTIKEIGYDNGQIDKNKLQSNISDQVAAIVIQSPNFFGIVEDVQEIARLAHKNQSLLIVSVDPISLGILKSPGESNADIVVGEGQSLGNSMSFGGPCLGFFATSKQLMRKMPGRIVGETTDIEGKRAFVLTMQTREQHIRREKATSNICSNQALNALKATVYLTALGKNGIKEVAMLCLNKAHYLNDQLIKSGKFNPVFSAPFFREFVLKSNCSTESLNDKLLADKIIGGYSLGKKYSELENGWLLAVTEKRTRQEIDRFVERAVSYCD